MSGADRHREEEKRCYLKHTEEGLPIREIGEIIQVPKTTVHRWIRWSEDGRQLRDFSRRPKNPRKKNIEQSLLDEIFLLRTQRHWGPDKIHGYLLRKGIDVSQSTIYRLLKKKQSQSPS